MPWQERSAVLLRQEFVELARQEGANVRDLCRRYVISPKTAYKWLGRTDGLQGAQLSEALADRSRRPARSPRRSSAQLEQAVLEVRREHPAWGSRKIARRLADLQLGQVAPSTVTAILHRHGLIDPAASDAARPWQRFEHEAPNALWQIDFKGYFDTLQGRCHPLTLLDDHSRFNLTLRATHRTGYEQVQPVLQEVLRRYGMPVRINADNGAPWGSPNAEHGLSRLSVWLMRLGIRLSHSSAYHPQTNGKLERFHRTLQAEVLGAAFEDHPSAQRAFDRWRVQYNTVRPHEALGLATPAQRYRPSPVPFPEQLPAIEYGPQDHVVRVNAGGAIRYQKRLFRISEALAGLEVAIRRDAEYDDLCEVWFCHQRVKQLDLAKTASVD